MVRPSFVLFFFIFLFLQDLELSVPERLEKYSGKLAKLGRAVARLAAAGKKVETTRHVGK